MYGGRTVLSNKDFLSFLNDKSVDTSSEETLKKIIDEELQKDVESMDTQRIEFCLDAISRLQENEQPQEKKEQGDANVKRRRLTFKRILILAAALVLLLTCIVFDSADKQQKLFGGIVEVFNDYVRIHFSDTDTEETALLHGTELDEELAANGFDGVVLPEIFRSAQAKVTHIGYDYTELINSSVVFVSCDNMEANIHVTRFEREDLMFDWDISNVTSEIIKVETQDADIFCCEQGDLSSLNYRSGLDLYTILLCDTPLEKAVELAKTVQ